MRDPSSFFFFFFPGVFFFSSFFCRKINVLKAIFPEESYEVPHLTFQVQFLFPPLLKGNSSLHPFLCKIKEIVSTCVSVSP